VSRSCCAASCCPAVVLNADGAWPSRTWTSGTIGLLYQACVPNLRNDMGALTYDTAVPYRLRAGELGQAPSPAGPDRWPVSIGFSSGLAALALALAITVCGARQDPTSVRHPMLLRAMRLTRSVVSMYSTASHGSGCGAGDLSTGHRFDARHPAPASTMVPGPAGSHSGHNGGSSCISCSTDSRQIRPPRPSPGWASSWLA
jgi:hypothetical protein